jgi:hypothetical protein
LPAIRARFRADLRGRWRAWVGLGLLLGLFAGAVLGAVAGARRTDSAYRRFSTQNRTADERVGELILNKSAAPVSHSDVAGLGPAGAGLAAETDGLRMYAFSDDLNANAVASPDGRAFGTGLDRTKVVNGRLARPDRVDEMTADFTVPGVHVGDRVSLHFLRTSGPSPLSVDTNAPPIAATFTVVGMVAAPGQFPPYQTNGYFEGANVYLTPAFYQAHQGDIGYQAFALVKVAPGVSLDRYERALNALGGGKGVGVPNTRQGAQDAEVQRSMHLQSTALWILAALLALVGLLVTSQLLARQSYVEATDHSSLRSLGMTRGQLFSVGAIRVGIIALAATVTAIIVAAGLSPFTPIGLARTAEPAPGLAFDGLVLAAGAVAVLAIVVLISLWPVWRNTSAAHAPGSAGGESNGPSHSSTIADALSRRGAPVTVTSGVRMALEPGRGRTAVPVRTTLTGAVVAMVALAAAITFGASLTHLLHSPRLYGVTWDTEVMNSNGPEAVPPAVDVISSDPNVEGAAWTQAGLQFRVAGQDASGFSFATFKGDLGLSILAGRAPAADDEIVLGSTTMQQLHTQLGQSVQGIAENERATPVAVRVVGRAVLPPGDSASRLGQGAMATSPAVARMAGGVNKVRPPYVIAVRFRPGVDKNQAQAALLARLQKVNDQFILREPARPTDLVNFGRIENLPILLGGLLAGLAGITLIHLLVTSSRRRRRDLAILKTLGFVRGQVAQAVAWQAMAVGALALVIGVPLGAAGGRVIWRLFAERLGVVPQAITPTVALILIVPGTVVLANLIALVPAVMASRTRPALVLRSE